MPVSSSNKRIRAAATKDGTWPAKTAEFIMAQRSDIMIPFPMSPEMRPGKLGPYFEMRTYALVPGDLPKIAQAWEKALPARLKLGPLCSVWYSEY